MTFQGNLFKYQEHPVEHFVQRGSLLLAFGPGTGKTIITIAAADKLLDDGYISYCLILCPASLKYQWVSRIKSFSSYPATMIEGMKQARAGQYTIGTGHPGYIVASYDTVIHDYDVVSKLTPDMVVVDEASCIKSFRTHRSKRIKKLYSKVPYRLALTATPIENKPEELFSIMQFVDPAVLGRYDLFEKAYIVRNARGWVDTYKNLDVLHERIGDAMLRKTRFDPDVRPFLPDVNEEDWVVAMPAGHSVLYNTIASDMLTELADLEKFSLFDAADYYAGADESTPPGKLMAMHMCMEMLLDHPDLIIWSGMEYEDDSPYGSAYANMLWQSGSVDDITTSFKLDFLKERLAEILADPKSKVLIYTKYKQMLRILKNSLPWPSVIYEGDMSAREKDAAVGLFTSAPGVRLFLSSYAGGYGLDLNMADYLINYDLPWSFGAQDQINSRHIRASSNFSKVYIRNIVTFDSIEERKMRILARKRAMSELAVDGTKHEITSVDVGFDFLRDHLRFVTGA